MLKMAGTPPPASHVSDYARSRGIPGPLRRSATALGVVAKLYLRPLPGTKVMPYLSGFEVHFFVSLRVGSRFLLLLVLIRLKVILVVTTLTLFAILLAAMRLIA